ncbi:MAG: transglutaminase domain-containing protein [Desulfobacterales bacterium]|nr:transglutaminase domain-containing protein [Desulfobacterales bacterium]
MKPPEGGMRNLNSPVIAALIFLLMAAAAAKAENYLLTGEQYSQIRYRSTHRIRPSDDVRSITLTYVIPHSFHSTTVRQDVGPPTVDCQPQPAQTSEKTDAHGNRILELTWPSEGGPVSAQLSFDLETSVSMNDLRTDAPFPVGDLPSEVGRYLASTAQVPAQDPRIVALSRELTGESSTQFDAVQKILTWMVDHLRYVLTPEAPDALYALENGRGNCQNYSHLAASLLRASGIATRIVNGFTLKKPYDIHLGGATLTMKMAQGRHSWIEVYFPDLGWVPFDPQGSELFVSNRFIRVEIGMDNAETIQDGLLRWTRVKGSSGRPEFAEEIDARFDQDRVEVSAVKADYGPREILLCPQLEAAFTQIKRPEPPPPPEEIPPARLQDLSYRVAHAFGNLEFPRGVDFLSGFQPPEDAQKQEIRRNFLVETAEYVTTKGQQYAQTFLLERPMLLESVSLALHCFNQDGQLWVELFKDGGGAPAEVIATSDIRPLSQIPFTPGYDWVEFDFSRSPVVLSPGRYWIALGFTGAPIANWFFSYGKPVGPEDGTRYRTMFDEDWSRSLSYEFNYRVSGRIPAGEAPAGARP